MEKQTKDHKGRLTQKCPNSLLGPRMSSGSYLPLGTFRGSQVSFAATTFPVAFHQMFVSGVFVCVNCHQLLSNGSFEVKHSNYVTFRFKPCKFIFTIIPLPLVK